MPVTPNKQIILIWIGLLSMHLLHYFAILPNLHKKHRYRFAPTNEAISADVDSTKPIYWKNYGSVYITVHRGTDLVLSWEWENRVILLCAGEIIWRPLSSAVRVDSSSKRRFEECPGKGCCFEECLGTQVNHVDTSMFVRVPVASQYT